MDIIIKSTVRLMVGRYPVRDPFFKMMPRSLQNFMNAFTSSDYTMYPFATTNPQDFKNLQSVYLDATLHPLLKPSDFVQEGWRIGPENPSTSADKSIKDDLVFKGVVYNEMKGQMSDAAYLFYIRFMEHIIPALNNSGGDPQKMTELTYDQLKRFHQEHYHPSNSKIITYGDQSVESHLEMLGQVLGKFEKTTVDNDIKTPIDFSGGAKTINVPGPVDPLTAADSQYKSSTTWLMNDATEIAESFALRIATTLLLDGYGSPMYQELIESGLGTDFTPNTGYDTSGTKAIFSVGLTGVSAENVTKVRDAVRRTIQSAINTGIDKSKVQGLLHQMELGLKHKTATFGMDLVQRLKPGWFNGIDPFDALAWNKTVEHFKAQYAANPRHLEELLEKYLLTEDTLTFTMTPSSAYGEELVSEEAARLQTKIAEAVSKYPSERDAVQDLCQREVALQAEQEAGRDENLECLPSLKVSDIPRSKALPELRDASAANGDVQVQWYEAPTNGLTYFRSVIPFEKDELTPELRILIPLFNDALLRVGTKDKSIHELEDLIKLHTGGISFGYHTSSSAHDASQATEGLVLASYGLQHNIPKMYDLIRTVLLETDFESPKAKLMIRELISSSAASAMDAMSGSGHAYAKRFAESGISPAAHMSEQTGGVTQVKYISRLAASADSETSSELDAVMHQLKHIQTILARKLRGSRHGVRVALTCSSDAVRENETILNNFLASCADTASGFSVSASTSRSTTENSSSPSKALLLTPFQVSHLGLALPIPSYTAPNSAAYTVLSELLTHKLLHPSIREQGGAYGAGAASGALSGTFAMYTYRDPNPVRSVGVLREAGRWALTRVARSGPNEIQRELDEAKMLIFQSVDAPVSVADMGMKRFLHGIDQEMEAQRRQRLLDVDAGQVLLAAENLVETLGDESKVRWAVLGKGFAAGEPEVESKVGKGWERVDLGLATEQDVE